MKNLDEAVRSFRQLLLVMALFSFFANLLQLTIPLYMLQIYDRVLPSNSTDTLLFLSLLAAFALAVLGLTEMVRQFLGTRASARLDAALSTEVVKKVIRTGHATEGNIQPIRDLQGVQLLLSSRVAFNVIDLPFASIFIVVLYFIHPNIFWLTIFGAVLLVAITIVNQRMSMPPSEAQAKESSVAMRQASFMARNSDSINSMGMLENMVDHWKHWNNGAMIAADQVGKINSFYSGLSSSLRLGIQAAVLGYGAWLVQQGEMTAGMIFASSIISGRALQPILVTVASWKQLNAGWRSWKQLREFLSRSSSRENYTQLNPPQGNITVQHVLHPNPSGPGNRPILNRVSFELKAGESVAVVGASGSGKTTLARMIVGAIKPVSGHVRLDDNDLANWNPEELGRYIGYLEQDVELLPGTIAQNIARFRSDAKDEDILQAAKLAHVEDLIQAMPAGYDTLIGPGGQRVSGGEKQRIALARAFFGNPRVLVLDEPNSSLDRIGEHALQRALMVAKQAKITVFLVTQRESVLGVVDKILRMEAGQITDFGDRDAVVRKHKEAALEAQQNAKKKAAASSKSAEGYVIHKPNLTAGKKPEPNLTAGNKDD